MDDISWAKSCSRNSFCLFSSPASSSNEPVAFFFSSCEITAPVTASIVKFASQQGQMMLYFSIATPIIPYLLLFGRFCLYSAVYRRFWLRLRWRCLDTGGFVDN